MFLFGQDVESTLADLIGALGKHVESISEKEAAVQAVLPLLGELKAADEELAKETIRLRHVRPRLFN